MRYTVEIDVHGAASGDQALVRSAIRDALFVVKAGDDLNLQIDVAQVTPEPGPARQPDYIAAWRIKTDSGDYLEAGWMLEDGSTGEWVADLSPQGPDLQRIWNAVADALGMDDPYRLEITPRGANIFGPTDPPEWHTEADEYAVTVRPAP